MSGGEDLVGLFQKIGLSESKAKETAKNTNLSKNLQLAISHASKQCGSDMEKSGSLLYNIASKIKPQISGHLPLLSEYVARGKLDSEVRVQAALEYLLQHPAKDLDVKAFEDHCGVGIVVTPEMIESEVEKAIGKVKDELIAKRYRYNTGMLMGNVRKALKWADGKAVKSEIDVQVLDILGPKTEADLAPPPKAEKKPKEPKAVVAKAEKQEQQPAEEITMRDLMKNINFHKPGENYKTDGYVIEDKTMDRLQAHLKRTGAQVRTRFPPEPNGILHVGHAKAININFGYAAAHDGVCFLRFDDTNPEKEEEKFFTAIKDIVEWLGYKPYKITHSSDNFQQLYEWAKVRNFTTKIYAFFSKEIIYFSFSKKKKKSGKTQLVRNFNKKYGKCRVFLNQKAHLSIPFAVVDIKRLGLCVPSES